MAFCASCGSQVADGTSFCQKCGKPVAGAAPPPGNPHAPGAPATAGLDENIASLLCYVLGWVTGLIFFFIDKRPNVRFHAAQSIVVFGGLHVIYYIMTILFFRGYYGFYWGGFGGGWLMLFSLMELASFVLWILLMVKAYQGERFRVPIAADFADSLVGKVKA